MSETGIRYVQEESGVVVITVDRPKKLNAVNTLIAEGLEEAWLRFEEGDARVAVITGAGGNFTAGMDVSDAPSKFSWSPQLGVRVTKPVIAAVEGWCIGAGIILTQNADLCIASETARFRYPEAHIGLTRGLAVGLATKVPHKLAMEIMLMGRAMTAAEMHHAGLVNKVTAAGQALAVAVEWAEVIAKADLDAVRFIKAGVEDTVPRGAAEIGEALRWRSGQLPANRKLIDGLLSVENLRSA